MALRGVYFLSYYKLNNYDFNFQLYQYNYAKPLFMLYLRNFIRWVKPLQFLQI